MHISSVRKQYVGMWEREGDFTLNSKIYKSNLGTKTFLGVYLNSEATSLYVQTLSKYNERPAYAAFVTIRFLLTEVSCNVTLKYTVFYKSIMDITNTICIHYKLARQKLQFADVYGNFKRNKCRHDKITF